MAQNRQGKQEHTSLKERNVWQTTQDVASNETDDRDFSQRLSRCLDHVSVNEHLIQFRRQLMLALEREITLIHRAGGLKRRTYLFGSQIEGTTTVGMMSDTDFLQRFDTLRSFLESENPPLQPHDHQVVIKVITNGCASQYCVLSMTEPSTQEKLLQKMDPCRGRVFGNFYGRDCTTTHELLPHAVLFTNRNLNQHPELRLQSQRHGPAENILNTDQVYACYCKSSPNQCKFVFKKPRPGHWPSEETLKKAKKYGVFIVPQGPPKCTNICTYDMYEYQWRISTNLTERLFMFSLETIHLKAFVLAKIIRKELIAPEYQDRLSTFHFKTAFFFAIENTRPDVWREENLVNCVKYILATLKRFLTRRNCPHFTIENVNLFYGKIERQEFPKLVYKLTDIINSLRTKIENIQTDYIGTILNNARNNDHVVNFINSALLRYVLTRFTNERFTFTGFKDSEIPVKLRKVVFEFNFSCLQTKYCALSGKYRKYEYALHEFMSRIASSFASAYLEEKEEGRGYDHDDINKVRRMYAQPLESDISCNHMRYASFLFCNREYDEARKYLDLIERHIEEDKTTNLVYQLFASPSESLALQIAKQSCEQTFKQKRSAFLNFSKAEAMCVPAFLRYEMYRDTFIPFGVGKLALYEFICVQLEPYLYYLQYLTYRELRQETLRSATLVKLSTFIESMVYTRFMSLKNFEFAACGYFDTSLNMLGHCYEMENNLVSAWKTYTISLQLINQGNAAALHITRLLWQVVQSLQT